MTTVIKKSNFKSFLGSFVMAMFPLGIGVIFTMAPFLEFLFGLELFSDLGLFLSIILLLVGIFACFQAKSALKSSFAFLGASGGWRVEITDETLRWDSPMEDLQKSFEINLNKIKYVESIRIEDKDSSTGELGARNRYIIHMHSGPNIQPRGDISGIWPYRVFKALEKHGVTHEKTMKYL